MPRKSSTFIFVEIIIKKFVHFYVAHAVSLKDSNSVNFIFCLVMISTLTYTGQKKLSRTNILSHRLNTKTVGFILLKLFY